MCQKVTELKRKMESFIAIDGENNIQLSIMARNNREKTKNSELGQRYKPI